MGTSSVSVGLNSTAGDVLVYEDEDVVEVDDSDGVIEVYNEEDEEHLEVSEEVEDEGPPEDTGPTLCAICKQRNPDFTHKCGADFHNQCLDHYWKVIGSTDQRCPHCLEPISATEDAQEEEEEDDSFEEEPKSEGREGLAQQYLDLTNHYYLELINDNMYHVRIYINNMDPGTGIWHMFPIIINYTNYPERPRLLFPDEFLTTAMTVDEVAEMLETWDPKEPPQIIDLVRAFENAIKDRNRFFFEMKEMWERFGVKKGEKPLRTREITLEENTYGGDLLTFTLNFIHYPKEPKVIPPQAVALPDLKALKEWVPRESKVPDLAQEVIDHLHIHHRKEFEKDLLARVFDAEVTSEPIRVIVAESILQAQKLVFDVTFGEGFPEKPPELELVEYSGIENDVAEKAMNILDERLKGWKDIDYVEEILRSIGKEIFERDRPICGLCRKIDCPKCTFDILTANAACDNCGRLLHIHCKEEASHCPYCLNSFEVVLEVKPTEE